MDPTADPSAPFTDPTQLPALLQQLVADLADPAITYLLGGHYYDRTNHPRYRHFPAVFALRQGEVDNVEVGLDFVAFDTELVRYPERGERHYPGPWADHFRATVPFAQLYQLSSLSWGLSRGVVNNFIIFINLYFGIFYYCDRGRSEVV